MTCFWAASSSQEKELFEDFQRRGEIQMLRSYAVTEFGQDLTLIKRELPVPKGREVLIRNTFAGMVRWNLTISLSLSLFFSENAKSLSIVPQRSSHL